MIICGQCGRPTAIKDKICPVCGSELQKTLSQPPMAISSISPLDNYPTANKDVLSKFDERLRTVSSPEEAAQWAEVRRLLTEQIENASERQFQRELLKRQLQYRWGFSLLAFASGIILSAVGYDAIGFFSTGAGLSVFAKDWVMAWIKRGKTDENDEE